LIGADGLFISFPIARGVKLVIRRHTIVNVTREAAIT